MYFANPWGLLALLAIPAIVVIHMYHRRFPPLVVAGLHLWSSETRQNLAGRQRERLPITRSLLLELLAALLMSLLLSQPRWGGLDRTVHLVAILDSSASMQGRPVDAAEPSFRDAAIAELERRAAGLPRGSLVTLILTGLRPTMLAGPAVPWDEARRQLANWRPAAPRHSFVPAWDLGVQLVEGNGELLFLTDHLPRRRETQTTTPDEQDSGPPGSGPDPAPRAAAPAELGEAPERMEIVSVGRRLNNAAISAARWSFDSTTGRGTVFVRVQNQSRRPADVEVRGRRQEQVVFRRRVSLPERGAASFEAEVPGGLGQLTIELTSGDDGLALDNRVELIEPSVRTVTYSLLLPTGESTRLLKKVLDVLPDVQAGDAQNAHIVFAPAGTLPAPSARTWWAGIGPVSLVEDDVEAAKDLAGPYLLDKRHPLLEGIVLGGVVWGGVQAIPFEVTPLISSGKSILLSRLAATRTVGYLFNIDLERSNLGESPDWPILLTNLIELRRENLPGLQRWNYRLGEEVRFRLFEGEVDPQAAAGGELALVHDGKSKAIARSPQVEISAPDEPGIYELQAGETPIGRFAVNFFDAEESDLRNLTPGRHEPSVPTVDSALAIDNPYSWLILLCLAALLAVMFGDWLVLKDA